jgi:hypothetical protein
MNACEPPISWIVAAILLPVLFVSIQFSWAVGNARPLAMFAVAALGAAFFWWLNRPAPRT